jgi:hypothetical protein
VTFTTEGPEYWTFLAATAPAKALALYQEHVSPQVRREDLFDGRGRYVPRNRWNSTTTNGNMHLIQQANTLNAEIELAAAASIVRRRGGRLLTGAQELIECGAYGVASRNSDPHIGEVVNRVARDGAMVTLADPVGLHLADLDVAGWETPDGADPKTFWRCVRGAPDKPVRAVFEVGVGHDYLVGDITILGKPIRYGAQIVDHITIKLTGLGTRFDAANVKVVEGCVGGGGGLESVEGSPTVADVLSRHRARETR